MPRGTSVPEVRTPEPPVIDTLGGDELHSATAATSRAFWPDPMFGFFARDAVQEHRMLPRFMGAILGDAHRHGEVDVIRRGDRVVASASWLRPGEMPRGMSREMGINVRAGGALLRGRNRVTGLRLLTLIEKHHPHEPHWYLALLGVDPAFQGVGLGSALLAHRIAGFDGRGEPAYLETQKQENVPYYERHGFVVRETVSVADSPPVWLMWRDPR